MGGGGVSWIFHTCSFPTDKGKIDSIKFTGSEIGKQAAAKSKGLFSAEDWMCSKCVYILYQCC